MKIKILYRKSNSFIAILFFSLTLFCGNISANNTNKETQNNPKRIIKKELRNIKKGKTDTISSLTRIIQVLDNEELKSKFKKEGIKVVERCYSLTINNFKKKILKKTKKSEKDKNPYSKYLIYGEIIELYNLRITLANALQNLNEKINLKKKDNKVDLDIKINNFYEKKKQQKTLAADYFYKRAKKIIESVSSKSSYQKAYYDLLKANSLVYNYKSSSELSKKAIKKGTIYVNFQPAIVENSGFSKNLKSALDFAVKKYIDQYNLSTPFLNLSSNKANPDYTAKFFASKITSNVRIREPRKSKRSKTISLNDVKTEITATIYNYSKEKETSTSCSVHLLNSKKKKIKEYNISGFDSFSVYWATYTGNVKALSKNDKRNLKKEESFPSNSVLANNAIESLTKNTSRFFDYLKSLTYSISLDKIK